MAGALIAMGSLLADRAPLFEIDGTVTLIDGATSSSTSGFDCEGAHGYDDISPTAAVRVSDDAGTLLATGSLTHSVSEGNFCTFFFTVPEVPRGAASYDVEISHRGPSPTTRPKPIQECISLSATDPSALPFSRKRGLS